MKIVLFGTNEFSLSVLKGLIDNHFEVVACVTQPDKVNGRNGKISFSPIKNFCLDNGIPVYQFKNLNLEGEAVLKAYNPDIFITASFGQIIKQNILNIPKLGTYNVHASLLPKYRGAAPIQRAIMNGEKYTGITIMQTELGLDAGDMFLKKQIEILDDDTFSSVFNKLSTLGAECIVEFLNNFDTLKSKGEKQNDSLSTYAKMLTDNDYLINFNNTSINIFNQVRALENCYFIYNAKRYKVKACKPNIMHGKAGEILACNGKIGLIISTADTSIEIITIHPEGKQPMPAKAFMNANKFRQGDIIENS